VVVGIGADALDGDALPWAAAEAAARGSPLRLVHTLPSATWLDPYGVIPPPECLATRGADAADLIDAALELAELVAPEVASSGRVVPGAPARILAHESRHAALVVLGGRCRDGAGG
jgi:nucleotide-binding universal stress UspA family protein